MVATSPRTICCDGTGWTGNPYERCVAHYEPMGAEFFSLSHTE